MKRISIGSWAYTIGPYADQPIDFDTVCSKLKALNFDGVELGGFQPHPNPDDLPSAGQRDELRGKMADWGLSFSGLAANLWGEQLINTEDPSKYIEGIWSTRKCHEHRVRHRPARADTARIPLHFIQHKTLTMPSDTWDSFRERAPSLYAKTTRSSFA